MTTYSLALKGVPANDRVNVTRFVNIPDASQDGSGCATPGGFQNTCQTGDWMLIKTASGQLRWGKYDTERSTFANPVILWMTG